MKQTNRAVSRIGAGLLVTALLQLHAFGQGTIVYSGFLGRPLSNSGIDIDNDGTVEFSFSATYESVGGNPVFHTDTYLISNAADAALAFDGGAPQFVTSGAPIGSSLPLVWGGSSDTFSLLTISYIVPTPLPDPTNPGITPGPQYGGPLADAGSVAYLAARWQLADGMHYGWIRLSSQGMSHPDDPFSIYFGPLAADWAYNSVADEPILAGAVPEPATFALMVVGAAAFLLYGRRRHTGLSSHCTELPPRVAVSMRRTPRTLHSLSAPVSGGSR